MINREKWNAIEAVYSDFLEKDPPLHSNPETATPFGFTVPLPLVWDDVPFNMRRTLLDSKATNPRTFRHTVLSRDAIFLIRGVRWILALMREY